MKIPKVGNQYSSIRRETVAYVLDSNEKTVHFRTYEEETSLKTEEFWKYYFERNYV